MDFAFFYPRRAAGKDPGERRNSAVERQQRINALAQQESTSPGEDREYSEKNAGDNGGN